MTVSSAPCEATGSQSPRARFWRANAFRVLSVAADAELRQIDRQQLRLFVALELGEQGGTKQYGLPPIRNVSKEEILEAVYLLQRPEDRLIEELFWVHEMEGLIDGQLHDVLGALRGTAAGNTAHGAAARHNLAVMHSILGQECAESRGLDDWKESLKTWKELMDDDLFWTFMKDRARKIDCQKSDFGMMKAAVCRRLSATFSEEMVRAVKSRELTAVPVLVRIAMEHRSWLEFAAALNFVEQQEVKNGFVYLGAILDRLSGIAQQDSKANIRSSLVERERELRGVADEYGEVVRSLGELADADGWDDAVASSHQRLSGAYLSLLDEPDHAIRLIAQARALARDPHLLQSIEHDWRDVQRVNLCREADVLARRGDFAGAEGKLEAALAISTEEQGIEVKVIRDRYRLARESMERDRRQVRRATLCREADVLAMRGDFAGAERKLEDALAISTEEQKLEIKAMQDRYRWARVLRGVDTTRNNPILYTFNGIGATFYGRGDYDPGTRSYLTNHWLTFLFVPIFPLGAYRVTDADFRSYYIHGRAPLPIFLKKARWAIVASVIALVLIAVIGRGNSTRTVGATPTKDIGSPQSSSATEAPPEKSEDPPHSERDDIEQERTALVLLVQSLIPQFEANRKHLVLQTSVDRMIDALAASGVAIDDPEGSEFRDGMTMNIAVFDLSDQLETGKRVVSETLSPNIYINNKLANAARVIVSVGNKGGLDGA